MRPASRAFQSRHFAFTCLVYSCRFRLLTSACLLLPKPRLCTGPRPVLAAMSSSARLAHLRKRLQPDIDALPNRIVSPETVLQA